jgi:hypothetical protein
LPAPAPTAFGQNQKLEPHCNPASAEGVGARLVGDLPGTGSKIIHLSASGTPHAQVLLPLRARSPTRWSATPVAPTPSGQKPLGVSCNTADLWPIGLLN